MLANYRPRLIAPERVPKKLNYDQLFCPSLQDMCKLYLLATIDEYPVDVLAKLPLLMRKKLFMAMSIIDRVHLEGTAFLAGLEVVEYKDFIPASNNVYLSSMWSKPFDKEYLVSALFGDLEHTILARYCALSLHEAFDSFDCLDISCNSSTDSEPSDNIPAYLIIRLIHQIAHSLHFKNRLSIVYRLTGYSGLSQQLGFCPDYNKDKDLQNAIVIPSKPFILSRAQASYVFTNRKCFTQPLQLRNYQYFAEYCNLGSSIPAHLKIRPLSFLKSPIWRDYSTIRDDTIEQARVKGIRDITAIEPFVSKPSYPYLQELLRTVEDLTLEYTSESFTDIADDKHDCCVAVPYILMSTITANKSPTASLKSIAVSGIIEGAECVESLSAIAGFLVGSDLYSNSYYIECNKTDDCFHYTLSPPEGDPYLIESLRCEPVNIFDELMTEADSRSISKVIKAVVDKQMDNIKNVFVSSITVSSEQMQGSPEECFDSHLDSHHGPLKTIPDNNVSPDPLISTLMKFIKQPQFHSLTVSESPESSSYHLVNAFLAMPTSHDQTLTLSVKKADSATLDLSSSPSHGAAFKSLKFSSQSDNCKLCRQVVSLPGLCLKSIELQAEALMAISEEVKIDIPRVCANFCNLSKIPKSYETKLRYGVSRFLCGNVSLATIEFVPDSDFFSCQHSTFFPIINSVLNSLLLKTKNLSQKTLEEIRIQHADDFQPSKVDLDLSGMDDLEQNDSRVNKSTDDMFVFESSLDSFLRQGIHPVFHSSGLITGPHLADFFVLVQKLGEVSLRLPVKLFNDTNNAELRKMVPDIKKQFGQRKIPKIAVNREYSNSFENMLQILKSLTNEIVITD